jgi:hypothetical protein
MKGKGVQKTQERDRKRQARGYKKHRQRGAGNIGKVALKDMQRGCKKTVKGEYKDSQGLVTDPECVSQILDQTFFHPGSTSRNLIILSQKNGF